MSIARGMAKAAKAAKAQSRGLKGNRNAQGDFMPEEVQMKGVQDSVTPDLQNYIEDVKAQIDEIEQTIQFYESPDQRDNPGDVTNKEIFDDLVEQREKLVDDLVTKLEEEGVTVPDEIRDLEEDSLRRRATWSEDDNQYMI